MAEFDAERSEEDGAHFDTLISAKRCYNCDPGDGDLRPLTPLIMYSGQTAWAKPTNISMPYYLMTLSAS